MIDSLRQDLACAVRSFRQYLMEIQESEEGRLRFNLQVEGLARLVQDRLKRLH